MTKALTDVVNRPNAATYAPGDTQGLDVGDTLGNIIDGRKQGEVPHYVATTVVTTHRLFMCVFGISVALSVAYFFYRIAFLWAVETRSVTQNLFWEPQVRGRRAGGRGAAATVQLLRVAPLQDFRTYKDLSGSSYRCAGRGQ